VSEDRRRYIVPGYMWAYMHRRRYYYVAVMVFLTAVVAILLGVSRSLPDYGRNLSLNLAADLIGTIVVLFVIAPFIESYRVQFACSGEETYVCARGIVASHPHSEIGGLPVQIVKCNAKGEKREVCQSYSFLPLEEAMPADRAFARELFGRKYGQEHRDVILKLVEAPPLVVSSP